MNIFTETSTETRLDANGVPYEAVVVGRKPRDLGELWKGFAASFKAQEDRDLTGGHQPVNQSWYERETSKQLYHDQY